GKLIPDSISRYWMDSLLLYRDRLERSNQHDDAQASNSQKIQSAKRKYDRLTQQMATQANLLAPELSLLMDFYASNTPDFQKIKAANPGDRLKMAYLEKYQQTLKMPQVHFSLHLGFTQNDRELSLFGTRPSGGLILGIKKVHHNLDLVSEFRYGDARSPYSFVFQDSLINQEGAFGMYIGLEYTFDFIHHPKFDLGLSPGLGYGVIRALAPRNEFGDSPKNLPSFNQNAGLLLKYKFGKRGFIVASIFATIGPIITIRAEPN
ncbi:MAG: hypothetical protein AAFU64_06625, partial [Bacteroidota bacterium]